MTRKDYQGEVDMTIGTIVVFLLLASIMLWVMIGIRGHWLLKSFLIVTLISSSALFYPTMSTYLGWASKSKLPKEFLIYRVVIHIPRKGYDGSIELLLKNSSETQAMGLMTIDISGSVYTNSLPSVFSYNPDHNDCRLYKIPYSKDAHRALQRVQKNINENGGRPMKGGMKKGNGQKGGEGQQGQGKNGEGSKFGFKYDQDYDMDFHDNLLPNELPPKEGEELGPEVAPPANPQHSQQSPAPVIPPRLHPDVRLGPGPRVEAPPVVPTQEQIEDLLRQLEERNNRQMVPQGEEDSRQNI